MFHDLLVAIKQSGVEFLFYLGVPIICYVCSVVRMPKCKEDDPFGHASDQQ